MNAAAEPAAPASSPSRPAPASARRASLDDAMAQWDRLRRQLSALLRIDEPDAAWLQRLHGVVAEFRQRAHDDVDLGLYLLIHATGSDPGEYSTQHAMACALVGELSGRLLGLSEIEVDALVHAALTMNLSMTAMHDALARQPEAPSQLQRTAIAAHAEESARMLANAGVDDASWLRAVSEHHAAAAETPADAAASSRVALPVLLRRIDVYMAKLSRRASRDAVTPALAARDACLGAEGRPDAIGAALLRVLGLYPPGTFVRLANGDLAVVTGRGAKAHTPLVAALRRADGGLFSPPVGRDTARHAFAVVHGLGASEVRIRLHHAKILAS
jgi:hypothetical protein